MPRLLRSENAEGNLRREAMQRGIAPQRLVFAEDLPQAAHLGRLQLADPVLDTSPYNAHTTASDTLWAGVPLVTCASNAFASRARLACQRTNAPLFDVARYTLGLEAPYGEMWQRHCGWPPAGGLSDCGLRGAPAAPRGGCPSQTPWPGARRRRAARALVGRCKTLRAPRARAKAR